jgi:hypothetical protein
MFDACTGNFLEVWYQYAPNKKRGPKGAASLKFTIFQA